jgi:acetoin utilization protein AcuB
MHELNYLMSRTKVCDVMLKLEDVFVTSPNALVEDAALALYTHDIGSLPVVLEDNTVVGIITQSDIFKTFVHLMGVDHKGTRLSLDVPDDVGIVEKIAKIMADAKINISHIGNYDKGNGRHDIVLRIDTADTAEITSALEGMGAKIADVRVFN